MLNWTCDDTFKFIELYKSLPVLWNPTLSNRHQQFINGAWEKISEAMGVGVEDLKRKKEALMATYRLIIRKRRALEEADCKDVEYRQSWMFFDPLDSFLKPLYRNALHLKIDLNESDESEASTSRDRKEILSKPVKRLKRLTYARLAPKKLNQNTKNKVSKAHEESIKKPEPENDECELYGKLLIKKLKRFPESERQEIMLAIDSYIMDQVKILRSKEQSQAAGTSSDSLSVASLTYSSPLLQCTSLPTREISSLTTRQVSSLPIREVSSFSVRDVISSTNNACPLKTPKGENDLMMPSDDNTAEITALEEVFCD